MARKGKSRKQSGEQAAQVTSGHAAFAWVLVVAGLAPGFIVFVLPGAQPIAESLDIAAATVAASGVFSAVLLYLHGSSLELRSRLAAAWMSALAAAAVSMLLSGRVWAAFVGESTSMLGWALLASASLLVLAAARFWRDVEHALVLAAPWMAGAQVLLFASQLLSGSRMAGTFANSSYLGEAMVMLLPFVFPMGMAFPERERYTRATVVLGTIGVLAASGARLSLALALIWAVWAVVRSTSSKRVRGAVLAAGLTVVLVAGLTVARTEIAGTASVGSLGERPGMWRVAAAAFAERPLLGYGPDGYASAGAAASTLELASSGPVPVFIPGRYDPHNLVLMVAVSGGIIGLGLLLWLAFEIALTLRRQEHSPGSTAALWAVGTLLVTGLLTPVVPQVIGVFALALGIGLGPALAARGGEPSPSAADRLLVSVLGVVALVLAANMIARAPYERSNETRSPALAAAARSTAVLWRVDPHLYYLSSLHSAYAVMAGVESPDAQSDLVAIEQSVRLDAGNPVYAYERAKTREFYVSGPEAVDAAYQEVFERYPVYPRARATYAELLAMRGDVEGAASQLAVAELADDGDPAVAKAKKRIAETLAGGAPQ